MKRTKLKERKLPDYTKGEEMANMISHGAGAVFACFALVMCILVSVNKGGLNITASAIYGASMVIVFAVSAIYHGLNDSAAKRVMQVIDHCDIYIFICGCYTPILLCKVMDTMPVQSVVLLSIVWILGILGVVFNAVDLKKYEKFSMICYLGMGWCIVFAAKPCIEIFAKEALFLLVLGGLFYTIGSILYLLGKKKRYMHVVFHIFVLLGAFSHFLFIYFYVLM